MSNVVDVPIWAVVLLCLLVAGVLAAQNLGWLLWAKALLDARSRSSGPAPAAPTGEPEERTGSPER